MYVSLLKSREQVEDEIMRVIFSIDCVECPAHVGQNCHATNSNNITVKAIDRYPKRYFHEGRYNQAIPIYLAQREIELVMQRDKLKQIIKEKYKDSPLTHSKFHEPAGPELEVSCVYCGAEPGIECVTFYGLLTKSHRVRTNTLKKLNEGK